MLRFAAGLMVAFSCAVPAMAGSSNSLMDITPDGTLLACHWRRPFDAAPQTAACVHALLDARCGLTRLVRHEDPDVLLDVWSHDSRSVAEQEGLA